jgi:hypothetical protein
MSDFDGAPPAACFQAAGGISLCIASCGVTGYPTSMVRKGLTMSLGSVDLSEEGVGFGVPVLKKQRETIFPGDVRITAETGGAAVAEFDMNLVERLSLRTHPPLVSAVLNAVKEPIALLHRRYPVVRGALTRVSNAMRAGFGIRTTFERTGSLGTIRVTYRIDAAGEVQVRMEAGGLHVERCVSLIVMNEQGAHFFDRYTDSTGCVRKGAAIETWQEVFAAEATFTDTRRSLFFSLKRVRGARLFRGRELVPGRLAWAGLAYVLPPDTKDFRYDIMVGARG